MINHLTWRNGLKQISLAALALLTVACQHNKAASTASYSADVNAYHQMVDYLASDALAGRGIGTRGIDQAKDFIIATFKQQGLLPMVKGKSKDSFIQEFTVYRRNRVKSCQLSVNGQKQKRYQNYSLSGISGNGAFDGQAVFVGYCVNNPTAHYDSFQGKKNQLKGKVAIAFRLEPSIKGKSRWNKKNWSSHVWYSSKARLAASQGAVALLLVNPPSIAGQKKLTPVRFNRENLGIPIPVMQISTEVFNQILKANAPNITTTAKQLQTLADAQPMPPMPLTRTRMKGRVNISRSVLAHNVVGILPGAGLLKNQYIVLGGHYDHLGTSERHAVTPSGKVLRDGIYNGADDNASGTAGILMLAKHFSKLVKSGKAPTNRRSIIFTTFSGEESGLVGSRYMTKHLQELGITRDDLFMMVNFDMIGRLRTDYDVFGTKTCKEFVSLVQQANADSGLTFYHTRPIPGGSDHSSFHRIGVPAIFFNTGMHRDYHQPSDERVNGAGAVKILEVAQKFVQHLWAREKRLKYAK